MGWVMPHDSAKFKERETRIDWSLDTAPPLITSKTRERGGGGSWPLDELLYKNIGSWDLTRANARCSSQRKLGGRMFL